MSPEVTNRNFLLNLLDKELYAKVDVHLRGFLSVLIALTGEISIGYRI